jgi:hypothetical protein
MVFSLQDARDGLEIGYGENQSTTSNMEQVYMLRTLEDMQSTQADIKRNQSHRSRDFEMSELFLSHDFFICSN